MLLFKIVRWRNVIISLVVVVIINFIHVPRVQARGSGLDAFTLGIIYVVKKIIESGGESASEGFVQAIKPEFEKMVDNAGKKLSDHINNSVNWSNIGQELGKGASEEVVKALNSINWEKYGQQFGAGIRQEFEATMDKLFDDQIKPLLKDIDLILKTRIDQVDNLIDDKLIKIDRLMKKTFDQFQVAADDTIAKIQTEIIDYTDKTVRTITDDTIAKVKAELIDYTFIQFEQLRRDFRNDVNHFFDRAENLLTFLDCTEEKTRIDMQNLIRELGRELESKCPPMLCGVSSKAKDDPIVLACYKKLHLKKPPKSWQYLMIYQLEKCEVLSSLTPDTPIENVATVYIDLHNWAKRIACIQRFPNVVWESLEFKSRYQFWSNQ